ncbi:acetoin utilization protein AcuC [Planctomycetota bacterium]
MENRKSIFLYHDDLEKYPYPPTHPFNTARAPKVRALVKSMGWLGGSLTQEVQQEPADRLTLKKIHSGRYLYALKNAAEGRYDHEALNMGIGSGDCPVFPGLYQHSVLATGATVTGAKYILEGKADVAFNPSGGFHHAFSEKAAGFCYINDVALGCMLLAEAGQRVLYLDVDVHNGDGVAASFYDRRDVMTISMHENPRILFPGTGFEDEIGAGDGRGYCVNVPLPVGTYDQVYLETFESLVMPLIQAYAPDVFVLEFGADALAGDPLAHLRLTNNTYAEIIKHLVSFNQPILMTGGGGYDVENTVRAWALGWGVLSGADDGFDASLGMGGVMLESTDWSGGLRDRDLVIPDQQRETVINALNEVTERVKVHVFGVHGL